MQPKSSKDFWLLRSRPANTPRALNPRPRRAGRSICCYCCWTHFLSFLSSSSFQHQSNSSSQNVLLSFLPSFNGIIDGDTNFMFRGTTPAKHYKLSSLNCCCCSVYYHRILLLDVYKYSLSRLLPPTPLRRAVFWHSAMMIPERLITFNSVFFFFPFFLLTNYI